MMPSLSSADANNNDQQEEESKQPSVPRTIEKQSSTVSSGGGVALSGRNKLSLGFYNLNSDFALPTDFNLVKKLGKGAYGRVM